MNLNTSGEFIEYKNELELSTSNKDNVIESKLAGNNRYITAIEVSKVGWTKSERALLVNGSSLPDALCSSPLADEYNAPILLTEKDNINSDTLKELTRLEVTHITLIGSEGVISKDQENNLRTQGFNVERIGGKDRIDTSYKIAIKLNEIYNQKGIARKKVFLANGIEGLADATSVSSPAGIYDGVILYTNGNNLDGIKQYIEWYSDEVYIIGSTGVISQTVENELRNTNKAIERIGGINRKDTNAKVINKFFTQKDIDNMYIAKDGSSKSDELVDGLSVGALASKNNSPVILANNSLGQLQVEVLKNKNIKEVIQVGNGVNEGAFKHAINIINNTNKSIVFNCSEIPKHIKDKMLGNSLPQGVEIGFDDLSYLQITYYGFDNKIHIGEMVVNKKVAQEVLDIFKELYEKKYPIEKIKLIDEYQANDNLSMKDNNSSAFCYRKIAGSNKLSNHARGLAIDINPIQNPHVKGKQVSPIEGKEYTNRNNIRKGMIIKNDACYIAFTKRGWKWGGSWKNPDYQHFEKSI